MYDTLFCYTLFYSVRTLVKKMMLLSKCVMMMSINTMLHCAVHDAHVLHLQGYFDILLGTESLPKTDDRRKALTSVSKNPKHRK